jgi:hypothetical protein
MMRTIASALAVSGAVLGLWCGSAAAMPAPGRSVTVSTLNPAVQAVRGRAYRSGGDYGFDFGRDSRGHHFHDYSYQRNGSVVYRRGYR